jgi:hypothetical protein
MTAQHGAQTHNDARLDRDVAVRRAKSRVAQWRPSIQSSLRAFGEAIHRERASWIASSRCDSQ